MRSSSWDRGAELMVMSTPLPGGEPERRKCSSQSREPEGDRQVISVMNAMAGFVSHAVAAVMILSAGIDRRFSHLDIDWFTYVPGSIERIGSEVSFPINPSV